MFIKLAAAAVIIGTAAIVVYYLYCQIRHEILVRALLTDERIVVDDRTRETDKILLRAMEKDGLVRYHPSQSPLAEGVFCLTPHGRALLTDSVN